MTRILFALLFCVFASPAMAGGVVASIKPLHSLIAAVMDGDPNQPTVLVSGKESLHSFSLKPSQARALNDADVVFYISDDFEGFMKKAVASLPEKKRAVQLAYLSGISLLPVRSGSGFDEHEHANEHDHDHSKNAMDFHIWLSTVNTKVMIMEIARQLSIAYPDKRDIYFSNVKKMGARIGLLDRDLFERMGKLQGKPYAVFHDAYQYFDGAYGLSIIGAITIHPEHGISAKRVSDLRDRIKKAGAVCVFREPQFDGKIIDSLLSGTNVKSEVLDPEGALLTPGKELYFDLMEGIAAGLEKCLLSS